MSHAFWTCMRPSPWPFLHACCCSCSGASLAPPSLPQGDVDSIFREAGYHVQDEQEVFLPEGGFRRADLVAIHQNGEQLALDIQCTGTPDYQTSSLAHLLRQDDIKTCRYGIAPQGLLRGFSPCIPSPISAASLSGSSRAVATAPPHLCGGPLHCFLGAHWLECSLGLCSL